jgi:predicted nucleic acid-binding protein
MPADSNIIIPDTSCLILLKKIDELGLMKLLADRVCTTSIIQMEFGKEFPNWIEIIDPTNKNYQTILEMDLDAGEASAIALTLERGNGILLIDDLKGRRIAEKLNLKFSGTFGLVLKAKQAGIIKSVRPILDRIRSTNFRFSEDLFNTIIKEARE